MMWYVVMSNADTSLLYFRYPVLFEEVPVRLVTLTYPILSYPMHAVQNVSLTCTERSQRIGTNCVQTFVRICFPILK